MYAYMDERLQPRLSSRTRFSTRTKLDDFKPEEEEKVSETGREQKWQRVTKSAQLNTTTISRAASYQSRSFNPPQLL